MKKIFLLFILFNFVSAFELFAEIRIKDIARVKTDGDNQLIGYGLVVGLDGTGDGGKTVFTQQSITNMLSRMGVSVPADKIKIKNVAAVVVTARVSPFIKQGSRLDAMVSSIGDASSLKGGTLLITPLKALDGIVYSVAEGPVTVESVKGRSKEENFLTSGRVYNGALLMNDLPSNDWIIDEDGKKSFLLSLNQPDFTTAQRVVSVINKSYKEAAKAVDPGLISITMVKNDTNIVEFISEIERIPVEPDSVSKVVINERTGTVVMGQNVMISPVAVSQGSLGLEVGGKGGKGKKEKSVVELEGSSVEEVVKALNSLGVAPKDIVSIFKAIKKAGAMQAELEIL